MSDIGNSRELPIVAATAAGYVSEEELKEAGFSGLLPKPFSIDELMEATRHCIRERGNRQPDFSALLAFGDKRKTLEQLIAETEKEIEEVRKASERKDLTALNSWVHHLRSSWMVIRTERPLQKLHEAIHKEPVLGRRSRLCSRAVLEQGETIIEAARKEMKKWESNRSGRQPCVQQVCLQFFGRKRIPDSQYLRLHRCPETVFNAGR